MSLVRECEHKGSWYSWMHPSFLESSKGVGGARENLRHRAGIGRGCDVASPADAPSRYKLITSWRASLPEVSEVDLLRDPLSEAAHRAGEHVQKLGSSSALKCERAPQATDEEENTRIQGALTETMKMCGGAHPGLVKGKVEAISQEQNSFLQLTGPCCP